MEKRIIGRKEYANLPKLEIDHCIAKIDTGAYTSSIHVEAILVKEDELLVQTIKDGPFISFKEWTTKKVKSSNGQSDDRYLIETEIELGNKVYPIQLTLTSRSDMRYPILLGRKLLNKNFLVDSSQSFIL